eukprot:CAMPEP_0172657506 /NCGR_PEP_ID=MMETSP1074-20121228/2129_1 /TAXON_ID=2916 /ORGANISM="Ceratium fusus, Strain PA161109" /LENGTH=223 /DNA_ID=CAMNT_0013472589 /DNA_START=253 /DNA_END=924 /DNA_ORIENTATION=-
MRRQDGSAGGTFRGQVAPPVPLDGPKGVEDDKETAKQRLQRLIRDFAHDAVGTGLGVEVQYETLASAPTATQDGTLEAMLRMDRRLSCVEIWPLGTTESTLQGREPLLKIPLQQVSGIVKRTVSDAEEFAEAGSSPSRYSSSRATCTLAIIRQPDIHGQQPELRITFDNSIARDRAYTCLRIFQMSVDQSSHEVANSNDAEGKADTPEFRQDVDAPVDKVLEA